MALTAIAATVAQAANRALTSAPALPMWYTIIDPDAIAAANGSYLVRPFRMARGNWFWSVLGRRRRR